MTNQSEVTDDELLEALEKVGSDLVFRRKTRRLMRRIIALTVFSVLVSVISVAALIQVRRIQIEGCHRDNELRLAYVNQWRPIVADSPLPEKPADDAPQAVKDAYERNIKSRITFTRDLNTVWAPRAC